MLTPDFTQIRPARTFKCHLTFDHSIPQHFVSLQTLSAQIYLLYPVLSYTMLHSLNLEVDKQLNFLLP